VQRFLPLFQTAARAHRHPVGTQWRIDETYVRLNGAWTYIYRAIDQDGQVVDAYCSTRRNAQAVQAPNANAFAERWIRSVREECLDKILILNERHLHRVVRGYVDYYNYARPHQGIAQCCPVPLESSARDGPIERRDILGGVLHDYYRHAA
jgi:hypothetical protein